MTEEQTAEIFGFLILAIPYLDEMASRGDYQAKTLHEQAVGILDEEVTDD